MWLASTFTSAFSEAQIICINATFCPSGLGWGSDLWFGLLLGSLQSRYQSSMTFWVLLYNPPVWPLTSFYTDLQLQSSLFGSVLCCKYTIRMDRWFVLDAENLLFRCLARSILASHEPRKIFLDLVKRSLNLLQYGYLGDCPWYGKLTPNDSRGISYVLTGLVVRYGAIRVWKVYQWEFR